MTETTAVVVDPSSCQRLVLRPVALAPADRVEVTVRVTAISLDRGEVNRTKRQTEAGWRAGRDFVGIVPT